MDYGLAHWRKIAGAIVFLVVAVVLWVALRGGSSGPAASEVAETELPELPRTTVQVRPLRPGRVEGVVLADEDGQPIGGATVALVSSGLPHVVATDDSGAWSFTDVEPGRYRVTATAPAFKPGRIADVEIEEAANVDGVELRLIAGGHILQGTVSDVSGGPIDGATVVARLAFGDTANAPAYATFCGEEGHYELSLGAGRYEVLVRHPEYVEATTTVLVDAAKTRDFDLIPGGSIEGVVRRTTDGEPVAGATVLYSPSASFALNMLDRRERSNVGLRAQTDESGVFRLTGLPPGDIGLEAFAGRFGTTQSASVPIGVAASVTGVEIWVEPLTLVTGVVVWADTDQPVPNATVLLHQKEPATTLAADHPTGEDGRLEVSGVPPGRYSVIARGPEIAKAAELEVTIQPDQVASEPLRIAVDRGYSVRGRIEPPTAARVNGWGVANATSTAEEDGSFELTGLAAGFCQIRVSASDGREGTLDIEVPTPEEVVVSLMEGSSVHGVVVDTADVPVVARICARPHDAKMLEGPLRCAHGRDDGTFIVAGLAEGTHRFSVRSLLGRGDLDIVDEASLVFDVPDRAAVQDVRFVVEARDGRIEGTVVDAGGGPASDAWLTVYERPDYVGNERVAEIVRKRRPTSPVGAPVLADGDGRFVVEGLPSGMYLVVAEGDGGLARGEVDMVETGTDVVIHLAALAEISGRVISSGAAPELVTVRVMGPTASRQRIAGSPAQFSASNLTPGTYTVAADADGRSGRVDVEVAAGDAVTVEIELESLGKVVGRAVDRGGSPIAGVRASVRSDDPAKTMRGMFGNDGPASDEDGRFEVPDVPVGERTLFLEAGDRFDIDAAHALETFTIEAGETVDVGDVVVQTFEDKTREVFSDHSADLGLRFYAGDKAPTEDDLARIDDDPSVLMSQATDKTAKLWIAAVDPGGFGETAGFEVGDRVVAVGRSSIDGTAGVQVMLLAKEWRSKGRTVVWVVERDGESIDIDVLVPE